MKKAVTLIGKLLIILSVLYPFPLWFLARWQNVDYALRMPDNAASYWWWNLAIFAIGAILCVIGAHKSKPLSADMYHGFIQDRIGFFGVAAAIIGVMLAIAVVLKLFALLISIL